MGISVANGCSSTGLTSGFNAEKPSRSAGPIVNSSTYDPSGVVNARRMLEALRDGTALKLSWTLSTTDPLYHAAINIMPKRHAIS